MRRICKGDFASRIYYYIDPDQRVERSSYVYEEEFSNGRYGGNDGGWSHRKPCDCVRCGGNTAPTEVKVTADDSNLTMKVPTVISFTMTQDGTLTSSGLGEIDNDSNFAIHVKSVSVEKAGSFNIVADASAATEDNAVSFKFGKAGQLMDASSPQPATGQYNLAPEGVKDGSDKFTLEANGKAKNVKEDISAQQTVANITWTFAAGNAK